MFIKSISNSTWLMLLIFYTISIPAGMLFHPPSSTRITSSKKVSAKQAQPAIKAVDLATIQRSRAVHQVRQPIKPAVTAPAITINSATEKPSSGTAWKKAPNLNAETQSLPAKAVVSATVKQQSPAQNTQTSTISPYQFQMLARIISAEAKGEPFQGQVAVGAVILNRIKSDRFPKTIAANVLKRGQFEPVANGHIWNEPSQSAIRAAHLALKGWDPSNGALYFFNPEKSSSRWIFNRPVITRIGKHVFAA